jgi:carbon-monoxide dehydrogenase medium subunit
MKAPPFRYHAPRSLPEAVELLNTLDNARVLGGGQSLMPMLNLRLAAPDHVIDLGNISELRGIVETDDAIAIGAMTTQREIEKSTVVHRACSLLSQAVAHVGHQQTRNRGTIGGSLCHFDPSAELAVAASALDANLTIAGPSGDRTLPFSEFPIGLMTTALEENEILTRIDIAKRDAKTGTAFLEFNRRPADFAIVSVAVELALGKDDRVRHTAVAVGGLDYAPIRFRAAEDILIGQYPSADLFESASKTADDLDCEGDALYPAEYRRDLCRVLLRRALQKASRIC